MRLSALALLMAVACTGGDGDGDGEDTDLTDTSTTDTSEDTGETAVPCDSFAIPGAIAVAAGAQVPSGSIAVELVFVELLDALPEGDVLAEVELGSVSAGQSADFELCAPNLPPSSDIYAPDSNTPDFRIATYAIRAQAGDGTWVGASLPQLLFWVEGTIPVDAASQGLVPGWNRVTLDLLAGTYAAVPFTDTERFDFDAQLLYAEPSALPAELVPDLSSQSDLVVGGWNINRFVDSSMTPPAAPTVGAVAVSSAAAGADLELGLLGQPPDDHTQVFPDLEHAELAFYMVGIWSDADGSLSFETTETMHANSTSATPERTLVYVEPTDWRAAALPAYGLDIGWNVVEAQVAVSWTGGVLLDAP